MQKIIIKNFHAVEIAEVEVKKVLVLIGEQATGKSTIAKLIYFFKSLGDDLFSQIYKAEKEDFNKVEDFIYLVRSKFYNFFGSTHHLKDFEITYYYSNEKNKYIKLSLDERKKLLVDINHFIDDKFINSASQLKRILHNDVSDDIQQQLAYDENKSKYVKILLNLINELFESDRVDCLYFVAGRSTTVSYSDLFERYSVADIRNKVEENDNKTKPNIQIIEETFMFSYMKRIEKIKNMFMRYGNFDQLIDARAHENDKSSLRAISTKIYELLKGKYRIDGWGEKIVFSKGSDDYIYLSNASSGQQEVVRITQDIFLNILDNVKFLRVIEEPEAHLFPIAQKQIVELLVLAVNKNVDNQIIITTHSPYVLTVLNNLLFANRVVNKNTAAVEEVIKVIPKDIWLSESDFSAYSLSKTQLKEDEYCVSIVDKKTGLIQQNYLDVVSEMLGNNFDEMYKIHSKSFLRK